MFRLRGRYCRASYLRERERGGRCSASECHPATCPCTRAMNELNVVLVAHKRGSTNNPFFAANERTGETVTPAREVHTDIPDTLKPLYAAHTLDTEFRSANGLTFLSEAEMRTRSLPSTVDLAYRYVGMGHIVVHTYVKATDRVISHVDGGANDFERIGNFERRRQVIQNYLSSGSEGPDPWTRVAPLQQWWREELNNKYEA